MNASAVGRLRCLPLARCAGVDWDGIARNHYRAAGACIAAMSGPDAVAHDESLGTNGDSAIVSINAILRAVCPVAFKCPAHLQTRESKGGM